MTFGRRSFFLPPVRWFFFLFHSKATLNMHENKMYVTTQRVKKIPTTTAHIHSRRPKSSSKNLMKEVGKSYCCIILCHSLCGYVVQRKCEKHKHKLICRCVCQRKYCVFFVFLFFMLFVLFCFSKCDEQDITYNNVFANANADKLIELFVILYNFQLRCSLWELNQVQAAASTRRSCWVWQQWRRRQQQQCWVVETAGVWHFRTVVCHFARSKTKLCAREKLFRPSQSNTNDSEYCKAETVKNSQNH